MLGIADTTESLQSLARMIYGAVAELPILVAAAKNLEPFGYNLSLGDVFFDEFRKNASSVRRITQ